MKIETERLLLRYYTEKDDINYFSLKSSNEIWKYSTKKPITDKAVSDEILKEVVNGVQDSGNYSLIFDGSTLNSGVYFYKLETESNIITKKMILVK